MEAKPDVQEVAKKADELVSKARDAAAVFTQYSQADVDRIVYAAVRAGATKRIELARLACEETGMGVFEDKVIKNLFATEYIYNDIRDIKTVGVINECAASGLTEYAEPLGVILGITPVTNPTSTVMFKSLLALKTRNAIIICASRNALQCSNTAAEVMYTAALAAGAPDDCIRWVTEPSREMTNALMTHPDVALILATGGMGLVQSSYGSGKPAIGVGPGNVPVYIEKSADIAMAVNDVLLSKTFDNGMICASEQAVVVDADIQDDVAERFRAMGACFLKPEEVAKLQEVVIDVVKKSMAAKAVGQSAQRIAEMVGINIPPGTRLMIAPLKGVGEKYPLSREKLCPVLGWYVVSSLEEGVNLCTELTHFGGLGHSASIFSRNPAAIRQFGDTINAGRILVNSPSSQGGIGDLYNRLHPSLTLGCGTGGRNSTTDNVTVTHLMNIKRISKRMLNMKWFRVPPRIYFEPGCLDVYFQSEIKELQSKHAMIVCSGSVVRSGLAAKLERYLRVTGVKCTVFADVQADPTIETVMAGVQAMRKAEPDLIIAVGGGSPLDAAKAMWLFYEQPDLAFDDLKLRFVDIRKRIVKFPPLGRKARFIAIPTTSGTGSEVTPFTVVTDAQTQKKYPLADYGLTPDVAIIDANLLLGLPPDVTADTGMDALSHALESFVAVPASDFTDPLALRAIQLIFEYLPLAFADGQNLMAREKMHNASTIAGMAFANAFLGINHALAHIIGATFHIPHGRANSLVMIPVIRYNAALPVKFPIYPNYPYPQAAARYAEIAAVLKLKADSVETGVASLIQAIAELQRKLKLPATLRAAGVPSAEFSAKVKSMALTAFDDQCAGANPTYALLADYERLLQEAYG